MFRVTIAAVLAALTFAIAADAAPITDDVARTLIYTSRDAEIRTTPAPGISSGALASIAAQVRGLAYYGAVAASVHPDGKVAFVAAADYNNSIAARQAALASCKAGQPVGATCAVVADIVPKGWTPRALEMGRSATGMYMQFYMRDAGPKAFAFSPSRPASGLARGPDAVSRALSACRSGTRGGRGGTTCYNADGRLDCSAGVPATDCRLAIEN
ncbi:MAG: hypothetical protein GC186_12865 [Rhodobacteraceae bacterium]|nr:hypothetical protein [Paracoccaceae bacterium]